MSDLVNTQKEDRVKDELLILEAIESDLMEMHSRAKQLGIELPIQDALNKVRDRKALATRVITVMNEMALHAQWDASQENIEKAAIYHQGQLIWSANLKWLASEEGREAATREGTKSDLNHLLDLLINIEKHGYRPA